MTDHEPRRHGVFAGPIGAQVRYSGVVRTAQHLTGPNRRYPSVLLIVDCGRIMLKTFTSARWAWKVIPGDRLTLTGVVAGHHAYRGSKQTLLRHAIPSNPEPGSARRREPGETVKPRRLRHARPRARATPQPLGDQPF